MRITGGTARGHTLATPKSRIRFIRPTSDRTREALFSILAPRIPDSIILDLYAGTGALGIEALSRGAQKAYFVDQSRQALALIHANLTHCFPSPAASLLQLNLAKRDGRQLVNKLPAEQIFDIIFIDPPYERKLAVLTLEMVHATDIVAHDGIVVVEERKEQHLPERCNNLKLTDQRHYGETGLWFYTRQK